MQIWDLKNKKYIEEKESSERLLNFLYNTVFGRILLKTIFVSRWFSKFVALYHKSFLSKYKIKKFVQDYNINLSKYEKIETYKNFNDFFTRKRDVKKYLEKSSFESQNLVAIADSKLLVLDLSKDTDFKIKNVLYNIEELIEDKELSEKYKNGLCLIYRLSLSDYHRFVYLDNGILEKSYYIKGVLHTVRPISAKHKVFSRNSRIINLLDTVNFGKVLQVEIGAMLVGKIKLHNKSKFSKFDEMGYFEYGGSTIVQFFEKDKIEIFDEIFEQSKKGIETKVEIGDVIGKMIIK